MCIHKSCTEFVWFLTNRIKQKIGGLNRLSGLSRLSRLTWWTTPCARWLPMCTDGGVFPGRGAGGGEQFYL